MRSRCTLHKSKLAEFEAFCTGRGWLSEAPKGDYEVLRMRHPAMAQPLIVHTRLDAKEHLTTWGESDRMLNAWLVSKRRASKTEGGSEV